MRPYYDDDLGSRRMYDIDVVAIASTRESTLELISRLGWESEKEHAAAGVGARLVHRRHSAGFEHGADGRIDLHWHAMATSIGSHADDEFWNAARPLAGGGAERVMHPADQLLHTVVHGNTGDNRPPIQWIVDAHRIIAAGGEPLGVRLAVQARAHGVLNLVGEGIRVVEAVTELPALQAVALRAAYQASLGARTASPRDGARWADRPHGRGRGQAFRRWHRRSPGSGRSGRQPARSPAHPGRPRVAIVHAALGRPFALAWLARRRGPLSRVPAGATPLLATGTEIDFTDPRSLDYYGGPGWQRATDRGAEARGAEPRIVLQIDSDGRQPLWAVLSIHSAQRAPIVIAVDERIGRPPLGSRRRGGDVSW